MFNFNSIEHLIFTEQIKLYYNTGISIYWNKKKKLTLIEINN